MSPWDERLPVMLTNLLERPSLIEQQFDCFVKDRFYI
jgi:hypothetical protein